MSHDSYDSHASSAQLEREVEAQRSQVESRIDEIKERLSIGQLIDEAMAYTKDGGGAFASNLGTTISNNPLPATLLGVSLAWLIAGQNKPAPQPAAHLRHQSRAVRDAEYPYARIRTPQVRRVSHSADEQGQWWSEFEADGGDRYKAKSNETGQRLGHFADKTGKMFSGFIDETGNRIAHFQDESGNMLHDAGDWASHTWSDIRHGIADAASNAADGVTHAADAVSQQAQEMGRAMQKQSDQLTRQLGTLFEQQPLVAGALAFAAGAALGAALPHTRQEDQLVGKASDDVRREAGHMAADAYESGKEQVGEAYKDATETAREVYDEVKTKVADAGSSPDEGQAGQGNYQRH